MTNGRFPDLTPDQRGQILEHLPDVAKRLLDVSVYCRDAGVESVQQFFSEHDPFFHASGSCRDPVSDSVWRAKVNNSIETSLDCSCRRGVQKYLSASLGQRGAFDVMKDMARDAFWERCLTLNAMSADDGKPLLGTGDPRFETFWGWDAAIPNVRDADLIISNDLLYSVELNGEMVPHQILRGGVCLGFCNSSQASHGGTAVVALYPLLSTTGEFRAWRGGDLSAADQACAAMYVAAHELGHLLRNLDDEFGHRNCVMSPTPRLRVREWCERLERNGRCCKYHHRRSSNVVFVPKAQ